MTDTIPEEAREVIKKSRASADEWCGVWCRPIHGLIAHFGMKILAGDIYLSEEERKEVILQAHALVRRIEQPSMKNQFLSKRPTTIAAAVLYLGALLAGVRIHQHEFWDLLGVTSVGLRNVMQEIMDMLGLTWDEILRERETFRYDDYFARYYTHER